MLVLCCVLLSFAISDSSGYDGQTCGDRDQPIDNSTYCPNSSENVMGCQAAVNYTLRLVCSQCSADIIWQRWNGEWQNITEKKQVLEYPAKQVKPSLAGCYRCWCYLPGGSIAVATISVDVRPPEAPKLLLNNTPEEHGEFFLYPLKVHLGVDQQMVCMPFTSTGYPNVTYDMYYRPLDKDNYLPVTNQSCLEHSVVHRDSLCYIPPVANRIEDFMCVVHNIAGNISVYQPVVYTADPAWPIKPHPAQTSGSIIMDHEGGVGEEVCAAYREDSAVNVQYFVCRIPHGMTVEEAACLYNRHNLTCYQCGGVSKGFNSTHGDSVSDLGIETSSCLLNIWVEGLFVCLAQQHWLNGSMSIAQHIGNFSTTKVVPQPASHPAALDVSLCYNLIAMIVIIWLLLVILVCGCSCTWCCGLWTCKKGCTPCSKRKGGYSHIDYNSAEGPVESVSASDVDERTPLRKAFSSLMKVTKPRTNQAISVHLFHAASGVEQIGRCEEKTLNRSCLWNLYHLVLEPGVGYNLKVQSAGETLSVISFSAPGIVEPKEPLPRDVNRLVPLTIQKLMPFIPQMAADYEVIGILLGQEGSARDVRTGPGDARQKMLRILEEWKGTEEASWSALVEALENYTPHLCGVASGMRVFLRNELAKEYINIYLEVEDRKMSKFF